MTDEPRRRANDTRVDDIHEKVGYLKAHIERDAQDIKEIKDEVTGLRGCFQRSHGELSEKLTEVATIVRADKVAAKRRLTIAGIALPFIGAGVFKAIDILTSLSGKGPS